MEAAAEAAKEATPMSDPFTELENILVTMSRGLVDNPAEIVISPGRGDGFIHFEVRCEDRDLGALIGKRGSHADAMRTVLSASAAVRNLRVTVQFLSRDGGGR